MYECKNKIPHSFFDHKKKYITKKKYEVFRKEQKELYEKEIKKLILECCKLRQNNYFYAINDEVECFTVSKWDFIDMDCLY